MLADSKLMAFAAVRDAEAAERFYGEVLGLRLVSDDEYALVFDANGVMLRLQKVQEFTPHPFTTLGWAVDDIQSTIAGLVDRGVVFERYDFLPQDDAGVWSTPDGSKVAWFKDSDGNLLSLTEFAAG